MCGRKKDDGERNVSASRDEMVIGWNQVGVVVGCSSTELGTRDCDDVVDNHCYVNYLRVVT